MKTIFGKRLGDFTRKYGIAGMLIARNNIITDYYNIHRRI